MEILHNQGSRILRLKEKYIYIYLELLNMVYANLRTDHKQNEKAPGLSCMERENQI